MVLDPVLGNIDPAAYPDLFMVLNMVQKTRQRSNSPWAAGYAAMQADREHFWCVGTFFIRSVKRIFKL